MSIERREFRTLKELVMSRETFNSLPDASMPTIGGTLQKIFIGDRWYAIHSPEALIQPIEVYTYTRED
ncbi:MAG: hypothetical protein NVV83_16205 [Afipia sp.]|nr:hypothetical protein [Afipia sp.]